MSRERHYIYISAAVAVIMGIILISQWAGGRRPNLPSFMQRQTLVRASTPAAAETASGLASEANHSPPSKKEMAERKPYVNPDAAALEMEPPPGNYGSLIPSLRGQAKNGNKDAAYVLARVLLDCYRVNKGERSGYGASDADPDRCKDVESVDRNEARYWLQSAAEKGVLAAQLLYWNAVSDLISQEDMFRDPQGIQVYKEKSLSFLAGAASQGSVNAMIMLSGAYADGVNAEKNMPLAYAYRYAAATIQPGLTDPSEMFQGELSNDQVAKAKSIGNEIVEKCCR